MSLNCLCAFVLVLKEVKCWVLCAIIKKSVEVLIAMNGWNRIFAPQISMSQVSWFDRCFYDLSRKRSNMLFHLCAGLQSYLGLCMLISRPVTRFLLSSI